MTLSLLMRIDNKVKTRRITTRQAKAGSNLRRAKEGQKEKGGSEKDLCSGSSLLCAREAVLLKIRKPRPRWVEQIFRQLQKVWRLLGIAAQKGNTKTDLEGAANDDR